MHPAKSLPKKSDKLATVLHLDFKETCLKIQRNTHCKLFGALYKSNGKNIKQPSLHKILKGFSNPEDAKVPERRINSIDNTRLCEVVVGG